LRIMKVYWAKRESWEKEEPGRKKIDDGHAV
jgi:hypothetical protein